MIFRTVIQPTGQLFVTDCGESESPIQFAVVLQREMVNNHFSAQFVNARIALGDVDWTLNMWESINSHSQSAVGR